MTKVLIAGAGIGGLTLAAALRRHGIASEVYERAPALQPVGAGITIQMNAMLALRGIGLDEAVAREGQVASRSQLLTDAGRVISSLDLDDVARAVGAPAVALHRARLQTALRSGVDEASLRLGRTVTEFVDDGARVTVRFDDGGSATGDALVAADGLRSAVRRQLVGDEPVYAGYTSWRGVARGVELDRGLVTETWGAGMRFGVVPIADGETYWFATRNAPAGGRDAPGAAKASLLEMFGGWHHPVRALLEATPGEAIVRTDIADLPTRSQWARGRVALLGDAAHAMTPNLGQGGGQAIEDAVVLARRLAAGGDVAAALQEYERERAPRANAVVTQARRIGAVAQWEHPWLRAMRDAAVSLVPESVNRRAVVDAMRFDPR